MRNRDVKVAGILIRTDGNGSSYQYGPARTAFRDNLSVQYDSRGDHVHATRHEYFTYKARGRTGTMVCLGWGNPSFSYHLDGLFAGAEEYIYDDWGTFPFDALYNEALSKMYDKLRGGVDLSVDIGQFQQTRKMLSAADQVVQLASNVRGLRSGKGAIRSIGSRWLELQYGWLPLLGTVHECGKKILDYYQEIPITARGRSKTVTPVRTVSLESPPTVSTGSISDRCEIKAVYSPDLNFAQIAGRYSSLNPASIAWELLPYSFVVDWFYDIGGYIRNLETALVYGNRFRHGYVTYTRKSNRDIRQTGASSDGQYIYDVSGSWTYACKRRISLSSMPYPRAPVLNADLGSGRLLNAAALLSQFLR